MICLCISLILNIYIYIFYATYGKYEDVIFLPLSLEGSDRSDGMNLTVQE